MWLPSLKQDWWNSSLKLNSGKINTHLLVNQHVDLWKLHLAVSCLVSCKLSRAFDLIESFCAKIVDQYLCIYHNWQQFWFHKAGSLFVQMIDVTYVSDYCNSKNNLQSNFKSLKDDIFIVLL